MRLLDLFCGAGGAAMGYHQAGFEVVGVDIEPQPNYPFPFSQRDALDVLDHISTVGEWSDFWSGFDLIHASPPCQHHTKYRNAVKDITDRYEDLCLPTITMLEAVHDQHGIPSVVENVPGSHLHADLILCGSMFGLDVRRHREIQLIGWDAWAPGGCNHKGWKRRFKSSTGRENLRYTIEVGAWDEPIELQKECMGVDWTVSVRELSQMVPPAYAKWIGEQFLAQVEVSA